MWWWWCDGGLECSFVVGRGSWLQRVACAGHVHMVSVASVAVRVLSVCVAGCGAVAVPSWSRFADAPRGALCALCAPQTVYVYSCTLWLYCTLSALRRVLFRSWCLCHSKCRERSEHRGAEYSLKPNEKKPKTFLNLHFTTRFTAQNDRETYLSISTAKLFAQRRLKKIPPL